MSLRVVLRDEAEADIAEAAIWYERQAAGLGAEFVAAVDECFALIAQHPEAFPVIYRGARLGLLRKFPLSRGVSRLPGLRERRGGHARTTTSPTLESTCRRIGFDSVWGI